MTTQDSYAEFVNYFDTDLSYYFDNESIVVEFSGDPTYLLIRLHEGHQLDLSQMTNAQIISIQAGEGYAQYVVKGTDQNVRLGYLSSGTDTLIID
jgi:hypothetical protein